MEQTTNYALKKPGYNDYVDVDVLNENMDIIDGKMKELDGRKVEIPEDFDNPVIWAGCTRTTSQSGDTWTEQIRKDAGNVLLAQRVTVKNADTSYVETYTFYNEDGTQRKSYRATTTKGANGWAEKMEVIG